LLVKVRITRPFASRNSSFSSPRAFLEVVADDDAVRRIGTGVEQHALDRAVRLLLLDVADAARAEE
jgi:hypothetical protein